MTVNNNNPIPFYVALSNNPLSHHVWSCFIFFVTLCLKYLSLSHCTVSYIIYVTLSEHILSRYTPFHLVQSQLHVFLCYTIHHSKYRFCLICVFVQCVTEQPSFSQQNSSLFLLSSPHPLFILSSHLISSPLILLFSQEAPGSTSMSLRKKEGDGEAEGRKERRGWRKRGGEQTEKGTEREWTKEKERVTKKEKEDGDKEKKENRDRDRQRRRGRVSNYRTPSVFKAPLLSHPSCGWEKEKQRKGGGGEED